LFAARFASLAPWLNSRLDKVVKVMMTTPYACAQCSNVAT
jgi:hypothetical protein